MNFNKFDILNLIDNIQNNGDYPSFPLEVILNLDPIHLAWIENDNGSGYMQSNEIEDGLRLAIHGINNRIAVSTHTRKNVLNIKLDHYESRTSITVINSIYKRAIYIALLKVKILENNGLINDF